LAHALGWSAVMKQSRPFEVKQRLPLLRAAAVLALLSSGISIGERALAAGMQGPQATDKLAARGVIELLEQRSFSKRALDDQMAGAALEEFVAWLDPNKLYFRRSDAEEIRQARVNLASLLKRGDISIAFRIYHRYQQRVEQLAPIWAELTGPAARLDLGANEVIITNPDALDFPKDDLEVRERWRLQLKYDLLQRAAATEGAARADSGALAAKVFRRYERIARTTKQAPGDWLSESFLNCIAHRFDPLAYYMSPTQWREEESRMTAKFEGIGVALGDDDVIVVQSVVAGGPAEKDGRLKKGDEIAGVRTENGVIEFADLTLRQAVPFIRGPSGSAVNLIVVPRGTTERKMYAVTRSKVLPPQSLVEAGVLEQGTKPDGAPLKIGYIELPSLYRDAASGGRSATSDVARVLKAFTSRNVDVVLLDLRRNYGGLLAEGISFTSLFINSGPVLQWKNKENNIGRDDDNNPGVAWTKPLVLLTSRNTSGVCENFCAVIQDYNRGLIVGDPSTQGRGTVQTTFDVSAELFKIADPPELGKLQLTSAWLYRANGGGIQSRGVASDLVLPSATSASANNSQSDPGTFGLDPLTGLAHETYGMLDRGKLQTLRERSLRRRQASADFDKLNEAIERDRARDRVVFVPLNEEKYALARKDLAWPVTSDAPVGVRNFYLDEVLRVTADYVNLLVAGQAPDERPIASGEPAAPAPNTPDPAVLLAKVKKLKAELLDADRIVEAAAASVAKCEKDLERWNAEITKSQEFLKRAETSGQRSLVGFGASFTNVKKAESIRNLNTANSALEADRTRLQALRGEAARTLGLSAGAPAKALDDALDRVINGGSAAPPVAEVKPRRARIGVAVDDINPSTRTGLGIPQGVSGAIVTEVAGGSPAEQAGLKQGDVIVTFAGAQVPDSTAFVTRVGSSEIGRPVAIEFLRNGSRMKTSLVPAAADRVVFKADPATAPAEAVRSKD